MLTVGSVRALWAQCSPWARTQAEKAKFDVLALLYAVEYRSRVAAERRSVELERQNGATLLAAARKAIESQLREDRLLNAVGALSGELHDLTALVRELVSHIDGAWLDPGSADAALEVVRRIDELLRETGRGLCDPEHSAKPGDPEIVFTVRVVDLVDGTYRRFFDATSPGRWAPLVAPLADDSV